MRSKRRSMDQDELPQETIVGILSRLPVKTLRRFESVSKPFSSLIKSTLFVSAHLARSPASLLLRRIQNAGAVDFSIFVIDRDSDNQSPTFVDIPFLGYLVRFPKIVASCNGLVCLDISPCYATGFVLWNISTKQFRLLPKPKLTDQARPFWMVATGFGFNNETDDYKLVRIASYRAVVDDLPVVRAEVFSWRTGSWRVIDGEMLHRSIGSCAISEGQQGVVVNGALHWVALTAGKWAPHAYVVSFHLGTEEFGKIQTPCFLSGFGTKIIGFKGLLALAFYPLGHARQTDKIELWVLQDYGADGMEWTRSLLINTYSNGLGYPVGVLNESTLVMKCVEGNYSQLSLFNPADESIKRVQILGTDYTCEVHGYVESLVPVEAEDGDLEPQEDRILGET